jgi:hypothetical protein
MRTHDDAGSGLVRYSFYSPEMNLVAETEPSTSATQTAAYEYVWFAGAPVAQIDTVTSTTHWTFTDHLGTPQIQTNAAKCRRLARRVRALGPPNPSSPSVTAFLDSGVGPGGAIVDVPRDKSHRREPAPYSMTLGVESFESVSRSDLSN